MSVGVEPAFMGQIRDLVKGDGLDLEFQRLDPMTGTLKLRLFAGPDICAMCVMSAELLEELALPIAKKTNASIRRVDIQDDRPPIDAAH